MQRVWRAALGLCALGGAWAGAALAQPAAGIYACTDARGSRITADRPIAGCTDRDQRVLGSTGVELRRVGPTLTENERAEMDERRRQQQAEQQRLREERARDKALLLRYPEPAVHDAARADALEQVDSVIAVAQRHLQELRARRKALRTELEFYQNDPRKAPPQLRRQLQENADSEEEQKRFLLQQDQEKQRISQRFDAQRIQLRRLWGGEAAARE
jgi:TolA-binding protein